MGNFGDFWCELPAAYLFGTHHTQAHSARKPCPWTIRTIRIAMFAVLLTGCIQSPQNAEPIQFRCALTNFFGIRASFGRALAHAHPHTHERNKQKQCNNNNNERRKKDEERRKQHLSMHNESLCYSDSKT